MWTWPPLSMNKCCCTNTFTIVWSPEHVLNVILFKHWFLWQNSRSNPSINWKSHWTGDCREPLRLYSRCVKISDWIVKKSCLQKNFWYSRPKDRAQLIRLYVQRHSPNQSILSIFCLSKKNSKQQFHLCLYNFKNSQLGNRISEMFSSLPTMYVVKTKSFDTETFKYQTKQHFAWVWNTNFARSTL